MNKDYSPESCNKTAKECLKIHNIMGAISCYEWAKNMTGLQKALGLAIKEKNISAIDAARDSIYNLELNAIKDAHILIGKKDYQKAYKKSLEGRSMTTMFGILNLTSNSPEYEGLGKEILDVFNIFSEEGVPI
jgi:hypothetical protein